MNGTRMKLLRLIITDQSALISDISFIRILFLQRRNGTRMKLMRQIKTDQSVSISSISFIRVPFRQSNVVYFAAICIATRHINCVPQPRLETRMRSSLP